MTILVWIAGVWLGAAVLCAVGCSRWFRWLRSKGALDG